MNVKLKNGTTRTFDVADIRKITFGTITGIEDMKNLNPIVKSFALFQNYPNPFNPSTIISYTIPRAGAVQVTVYDVLGRAVTTFSRNYAEGGLYTVRWDAVTDAGHPVASGLYFYNVTFEHSVVSKKMLFLR